MSDQTSVLSTEAAVRRFRSLIFKPAEGVFLFHPRAMERLIAEHLESHGHDGPVPVLPYYLMPLPAFFRGLETENPEALAVIEGLSLPDEIILLPMPLEVGTDRASMRRLLRDYWARRFEGEIARLWEGARRADQNDPQLGPRGLLALIGAVAFVEIREVLTRDAVIPPGIEDAALCRAFVAMVTRLRYFCPGIRGFFFPAIRDWQALDQWMERGGIQVLALGTDGRLPRLLERARPEPSCGSPERPPRLPTELPYAESDPDVKAERLILGRQRSGHETDPRQSAEPPERTEAELASATPELGRGAAPEARCLAALRQGLQLPRLDWRIRGKDWLLTLLAPMLELLLSLSPRLRWRRGPPGPARGLRLSLHLVLFRHAVRKAQRSEHQDHYAAAIRQIAIAERRFAAMGEPCSAQAHLVREILTQRRVGAEDALSGLLAAKWKLNLDDGRALSALIKRLGDSVLSETRARIMRAVLRDLETVLLESRTTYFELRPITWLTGGGRESLRQILPFQSSLKALRALDTALGRIERSGWSVAELELAVVPLQALAHRIADHLEAQLRPHLERALSEAGFAPGSHREQVAFHKLLRELLDVVRRRRHLKFTDARDVVARNVLRLPDLSREELLRGDRLARFDRSAARALPGVYRPGELYIKGLQQLGAPLFGTPRGRLLLRHLLLPAALGFLVLKTLDVLLGLILGSDYGLHLAGPTLVAGFALVFNAIAYTRFGRLGGVALVRSLWWILRLVLFDGLRRLARWRPVSQLLGLELVRGLDRNLLRPFLIGASLMLPVLGLASLIEQTWVAPDASMIGLTLALGILIRNTPLGRRLADDLASATGRLLRRLNQTLVIGVIQELMLFFKELTRRFQQGLHRIEEGLSHHLGESLPELLLKSLLVPIWRLLESFIQFYVTVLVEPQINPIKHFPIVTIAHKVMLPFLPWVTGLMADLLEPVLPKWIGLPFVTLTMLLLPGLAGFLVWELKENWKIYAANHGTLTPEIGLGGGLHVVRRDELPDLPLEPAIVGGHGETLHDFFRRGFHTGTLPKAFDRLRSVLRAQIRNEVEAPYRLREARRQLAEVERVLCQLCDRELAYALRRRCKDPHCALARIETGRPRLATASFELVLKLHLKDPAVPAPILLCLRLWLAEPALHLHAELHGPQEGLGERCRGLIREDLEVFAARAGATVKTLDLDARGSLDIGAPQESRVSAD